MDFGFSEEQEELRRYAREWLADRSPLPVVREVVERPEGFDRRHWQEMAEMGWLGMAIAEEHGGAGFGFLELAVLLEEQGRAIFPSPFLSTAVVAAGALQLAGTAEQQAAWLPRIAAGDVVATVAQAESSGRWDAAGIEATAEPVDGGWRLSGTKRYVPDGHVADLILVAAVAPGGVSLFLVDEQVDARRLPTMDPTRSLAEIRLDGITVPSSALLGREGDGWEVLESVGRMAAVAVALEQVGGAAACLEMATAYARERRQFGRPIGSFQAIKHRCADMLVALEAARAAAYYAAWAVSEGNDEVSLVAPIAAAHCSEAYFACAASNVQIHGGIGFTWEHDAHLHLKRAKSSELLFGSPSDHRRALAAGLFGDR